MSGAAARMPLRSRSAAAAATGSNAGSSLVSRSEVAWVRPCAARMPASVPCARNAPFAPVVRPASDDVSTSTAPGVNGTAACACAAGSAGRPWSLGSVVIGAAGASVDRHSSAALALAVRRMGRSVREGTENVAGGRSYK